MRLRWPEARIIHELQLEEGGVRIDLAAVGPDFIAVAEIKSEKDTLKRLHRQLYVASQVADECWLAIHPKHEAALDTLKKSGDTGEVGFRFSRGFGTTKVFWDRGERFLTPAPYTCYVPEPWPDPTAPFPDALDHGDDPRVGSARRRPWQYGSEVASRGGVVHRR